MRTDGHEPAGTAFAGAFARALGAAIPEWAGFAAELAAAGAVEIAPRGWGGAPFGIAARGDTVTLRPLCRFGLDYITTAPAAEVAADPARVFARPVGDIADFVAGRTVVAVRRLRWLGLKAGWDVRFAPAAEAEAARARGAEVIAWPG